MQGESAGGVNVEGCSKIRGQVKENRFQKFHLQLHCVNVEYEYYIGEAKIISIIC